MKNRGMALAGFFGFTAVALGAFGAHGLEKILSPEKLSVFHTGVEYQFYHSLALLGTALVAEKNQGRGLFWSQAGFATGILLFSGSLYLLSVFPSLSFLGPVTPLGGLCLIAGWLLLLFSARAK